MKRTIKKISTVFAVLDAPQKKIKEKKISNSSRRTKKKTRQVKKRGKKRRSGRKNESKSYANLIAYYRSFCASCDVPQPSRESEKERENKVRG